LQVSFWRHSIEKKFIGLHLVPPAYGFVREACGKVYFFGTTQVRISSSRSNFIFYSPTNFQETYQDTLSYCCDYGMTLLSVESAIEHQCLSDLNNGTVKGK
jgi:hypothetical protein